MKKLFLLCALACACAFSQEIRVDPTPIMTTVGNVGAGGFPQLLAVPYPQVSVCGTPANGVPCTNYATTYSDVTGTTACPTNAQIVLATTNACVSNGDVQGNFGFWVPSGANYTYTVTLSTGAVFGPYALTLAVPGASSSDTSTQPGNVVIWDSTNGLKIADSGQAVVNWVSPALGNKDIARSPVGGFPISAEFANGNAQVISALVGATDVPSNSGFYQAMGVAGYCRNSNTVTVGCVGVFGQAALTANGAASAGNFVATNSPLTMSSSTSGFNGTIVAVEGDVNYNFRSDGTQPTGAVYAFLAAGGGPARPTGDFAAYAVFPSNVGSPHTQWKTAFETIDGAADVALDLGAAGNTPSSVGGAILLHSINSSGTRLNSQIVQDISGNILLSPLSGGGVILTDSSFATILNASAHQVTMPQDAEIDGRFIVDDAFTPTLTACGSSAIVGSNTAGQINLSSGVTSCTMTFNSHTPFSKAPFCVFSSTTGNIFGKVTTTSGVAFTSLTSSDSITYVCPVGK